MHKVISVFCFASIAASLMAAPTANEDFVISEDAKTYTNAVNDANAYTDGKIAAIDVGVTSVNGSTGDVNITASDVGAVPVTRKVNGQPLSSDITIAGGVTSVNGSTGAVTISAAEIGALGNSGDLSFGENNNENSLVFHNSLVSLDAFSRLVGIGSYLDFSYIMKNGVEVATVEDLSDLVPTSRKVNGKALTGDVDLDAEDVGAFDAAVGASLQTQVTTIGAHLNAEDARFVVTNYNSVTHTPEAYVEIKLPDNSWSRIWSEMTRWNWLTGTYLPGNFYTQTAIDTKLAEKADRAWGFYDSTTGAYAPDDYTWISSPKIAIAANLAYQRTVTTEGAIWVLESNGTVTETGGMTNGFFRISDDEGNSLFEIVKGNKRTVGADAANCQTVAGFTPTKLQIGYSIVSDVHPTIYVCNSLSTQAWKAEDDSDCVANVSWSGASGAWVAQVQGKSAYSSLFVKATYEVGGETYISNSAPVSMQHLMLNGVKYAVGTATISGHTVLTLTVAQ